jgi:hypothetical protein
LVGLSLNEIKQLANDVIETQCIKVSHQSKKSIVIAEVPGKKNIVGWFQQYFSYIVTVSFIGGGNESIRRKPSSCRKSLTNFIT